MDLDWCYYLATKILEMSEEEFLRSTPKKIFKLVDIHIKMNSSEEEKKENKEIYVDSIL